MVEDDSGGGDENTTINKPTFRYRYDGQMCIQDDFIPTWTAGQPDLVTVVNSYAPGGRGLDAIYHFENNSTTSSYPVYDGHGNTVFTLARSTNFPGFTLSNARTYDVWGGVRTGAATGGPDSRYCGNLGHKQDDETGLIYMRARYYEPTSGRFISEDPGLQDWNWYCYCGNTPTSRADSNGKDYFGISDLLLKAFDIVQNGGRGSGMNIPIVEKLRSIIGRLEQIKNNARITAAEEIADAMAEFEASKFMGSAAEYQRRAAEIKMDLAVRSQAYGVVAQIAIHVVKLMIQLVQDGEYLP